MFVRIVESSKTVILQLIVENPQCLCFTIKISTGCKSCQMDSEVKTGVKVSDFHVLQYINILLSPLSSQPTQMDHVCVSGHSCHGHGRSTVVIIGFIRFNECYVDFLRFPTVWDAHCHTEFQLRLKSRQNIKFEVKIYCMII